MRNVSIQKKKKNEMAKLKVSPSNKTNTERYAELSKKVDYFMNLKVKAEESINAVNNALSKEKKNESK
jgi:hypothetical protein